MLKIWYHQIKKITKLNLSSLRFIKTHIRSNKMVKVYITKIDDRFDIVQYRDNLGSTCNVIVKVCNTTKHYSILRLGQRLE